MPMPMLPERDPSLKGDHPCHKCQEPSRYLSRGLNPEWDSPWKHWCRTCLDVEMYPALAHLTQEEREKLRWDTATKERNRSVINAANFKVGFSQ
jgi:hypothetical protein